MKNSNKNDIRVTTKRFFNTHLVIIIIIFFTFGIRIYFFRNTGLENVQDSYWLSKLAKGILSGKYLIDGMFWSSVEPLYPFLIRICTVFIGDYLLSGKIISLIFGTTAIPIIYLFWKKLESEEIAILTALLVSFNYIAWQMSLHVYRESLFLFLCSLSFLLYLKSLEDLQWMPWLGFILGLATLTRSEGFLLAFSFGLSFFILNFYKIILREKVGEDLEKLQGFKKSAFIYFFVSLPWYFFAYNRTREIIPRHILWEVQRGGNLGLRWISVIDRKSVV